LAELTRAELEQRIAELEGETDSADELPEPVVKQGKKPQSAYESMFSQERDPNWVPPARYVTEEYAREYSIKFKVGDKWTDRHEHL